MLLGIFVTRLYKYIDAPNFNGKSLSRGRHQHHFAREPILWEQKAERTNALESQECSRSVNDGRFSDCRMLFFFLPLTEERGYDLSGLTCASMGGHMASLAATNMDRPVVLVPCLSGVSAVPIYTKGTLSYAIVWDALKKELETAQFRQSIQEIP
ncbi:abhydrolase domain containing 18 domain-containing protein [Ditylenchus destructor]|nr:abhydrolase domain containing 18 domain-containing protein [Ditylenchus destructor]